MHGRAMLLEEMKSLRQELQHLKICQYQYFALSITGTGVILGLGTSLTEFRDIVYLAPLTIVFPCWWIFFDKATTISRIVGYYRVLESMLVNDAQSRYLGWERSLARFRAAQNANSLPAVPISALRKKGFDLLALQTSHKYWVISWYTFFGLAILCLLLGIIPHAISSGGDVPSADGQKAAETAISSLVVALVVWAIAIFLTIVSVVYTFRLVLLLIYGIHSYDANEAAWEKIL